MRDSGGSAVLAARRTLTRVLGLLGSDHDGEVLAAARAAERLRRQMNTTWDQLLGGPSLELPLPEDWRVTVDQCRSCPDRLTAWERKFLAALVGFPRVSEKQAALLAAIAERLAKET